MIPWPALRKFCDAVEAEAAAAKTPAYVYRRVCSKWGSVTKMTAIPPDADVMIEIRADTTGTDVAGAALAVERSRDEP